MYIFCYLDEKNERLKNLYEIISLIGREFEREYINNDKEIIISEAVKKIHASFLNLHGFFYNSVGKRLIIVIATPPIICSARQIQIILVISFPLIGASIYL